jgi:hypothetical protein
LKSKQRRVFAMKEKKKPYKPTSEERRSRLAKMHSLFGNALLNQEVPSPPPGWKPPEKSKK